MTVIKAAPRSVADWKLALETAIFLNGELGNRDKIVLAAMVRSAKFASKGLGAGRLVFLQKPLAFAFSVDMNPRTIHKAWKSLEDLGHIERNKDYGPRNKGFDINYADFNLDPPF